MKIALHHYGGRALRLVAEIETGIAEDNFVLRACSFMPKGTTRKIVLPVCSALFFQRTLQEDVERICRREQRRGHADHEEGCEARKGRAKEMRVARQDEQAV
ncbi:unnamed protein product [Prorocentrum cordatum]|uniref:Uncharacterized protein n=1 Tax=Prorocentrum cordatum TaxID=2364126 RepID=A0ABN9T136_9DINO|nr:unnamed protein product [Polarella glacialis]